MGEHDDEISLVDLKIGQAVMTEKIEGVCKQLVETRSDVNKKHRINRKSVHHILNELQKLNDEVWRLKLKIAGYASLGGAVTALLTELIKMLFHTTK